MREATASLLFFDLTACGAPQSLGLTLDFQEAKQVEKYQKLAVEFEKQVAMYKNHGFEENK